MDTVLSAPRSSYPDIVKLTEKNVQSGNIHNLKVVPGYYTVATDRGGYHSLTYIRAALPVLTLLVNTILCNLFPLQRLPVLWNSKKVWSPWTCMCHSL